MGVSITAFNNGDVMDPAVTTTNFTTIRNWLNGGIVTADIADGTIPTRAFRKLDHYAAGSKRSTGVTGTTTRAAVSDDPVSRIYCTVDSHGLAQWEDVATMKARFVAEDAGNVEVVFEWWAWAIQSDQAQCEALATCEWRFVFNGTDITAAHRTLRDAGTEAGAGTGGGPYAYAARNFQMILQRPVSVGVNSVGLQVKCNALAARTNYALIIVGARQRHLEYWRAP
jgi:hypothetical protein